MVAQAPQDVFGVTGRNLMKRGQAPGLTRDPVDPKPLSRLVVDRASVSFEVVQAAAL